MFSAVAAPIWNEVRQELYAFRGLMIFLQAEWVVPTRRTVYATDSSEAGWAFTQATWTACDIEAMARVKERSCFKRVYGRHARASALINAGLGDFLPNVNDEELWDLAQDFAEIPTRLLLPHL